MKNERIAIYPGTFDPVTNGHIDIMSRAVRLFGHLVVAVAHNPRKNPLFPVESRVQFIKDGTRHLNNIEVLSFDNLLTDFARSNSANIIIKGLRAISDFEFELQMGLMNRKLDESLETLFMIPSEEYAFLSSSYVKEIARHGGDIHELVPQCVVDDLKKIKQ